MHYSFFQRRRLLQQAWPIIVANASVPLLGLVDTAVIGQSGSAVGIGALAISNLIFNFIYWAFGFFRMSTTGFIAQARGAGNVQEAQAVFTRSVVLAFVCGCVLLALQGMIRYGAFSVLQVSGEVEGLARQYFSIRIWGAPATLALFGIMGVCIGFGRTRLLLFIQLGMNGANIILDVVFAHWLNLGVKGIAVGTLIAEWGTLIVASASVYGLIFYPHRSRGSFISLAHFSKEKLQTFFRVNNDMFIRTLFLLTAFAWFTNTGAQYGDAVLASNHILLLFISFSAFFLDGFAFVAEEKVGSAIGSRDWHTAAQSIYLTSELAAVTALLLGTCAFLFGTYGVALITHNPEVQAYTQQHLLWAVAYITVSVAAFQLDGIFIGATLSGPMRNASIFSFSILIASYYLIFDNYGAHGLWASFVIFVLARSMCLAPYWPQLLAKFK